MSFKGNAEALLSALVAMGRETAVPILAGTDYLNRARRGEHVDASDTLDGMRESLSGMSYSPSPEGAQAQQQMLSGLGNALQQAKGVYDAGAFGIKPAVESRYGQSAIEGFKSLPEDVKAGGEMALGMLDLTNPIPMAAGGHAIFAGIKSLDRLGDAAISTSHGMRTADELKDSLKAAQAAQDPMAPFTGKKVDTWRETGWFQGKDDRWRYEINDEGAALDMQALPMSELNQRTGKLGEALAHSDAQRAYPSAFDMDLHETNSPFFNGTYNEARLTRPEYMGINSNEAGVQRSTALHELQHAIQQREGFGRGGNPDSMRGKYVSDEFRQWEAATGTPEYTRYLDLRGSPGYQKEIAEGNKLWDRQYSARLKELEHSIYSQPRGSVSKTDHDAISAEIDSLFDAYKAENHTPISDEIEALSRQHEFYKIGQSAPPRHMAGETAYKRLAGEVEARNVQKRKDMSPFWRERVHPEKTEDVPRADQIVSGDGGKAMSIPEGKEIPNQSSIAEQPNPRAKNPALYHPISGAKKMVKPVSEMRYDAVPTGELSPPKQLEPESLLGSALLSAVGDRSAAGLMLRGVDGVPFNEGVPLQGGMDFMRSHADEGMAWASHPNVLKQLQKKAAGVADQTDDVNLVYVPMGHKGVDFSTMMTDSLFERLLASDVPGGAVGEFDEAVRLLRPEWKGTHAEGARQQLDSNGELRHVFNRLLGMDKYQKAGFPDLAQSRLAITEPSLMETPIMHGGQSVARMSTDPKIVLDPNKPHKTYSAQIEGDYMGGFESPIPAQVMFRDFFDARRAAGKPESRDFRALQLSPQTQIVDERLVEAMYNHLQRQADSGDYQFLRQQANPQAALPMDEASRMARAKEMGFDQDAYHGTTADFDEFQDEQWIHVGSSEQANNRILDLKKNREGSALSRVSQKLSEGENVMPLKIRSQNPLETKDAGNWSSSVQTIEALRGSPMAGRHADELEGLYDEAQEIADSFENSDDWLDSPENIEILDRLKEMVKESGYDSIKYENEVENAYGNLSNYTQEAQKLRGALMKRRSAIEKKMYARRPPAPENATAETAIEWANWRPEATDEERAALNAIFDELDSPAARAKPDTHSTILLDSNQLRSPYAAFDPAKKDSGNLLATHPAALVGGGLLAAMLAKQQGNNDRIQ